jgi:hypothetical protein
MRKDSFLIIAQLAQRAARHGIGRSGERKGQGRALPPIPHSLSPRQRGQRGERKAADHAPAPLFLLVGRGVKSPLDSSLPNCGRGETGARTRETHRPSVHAQKASKPRSAFRGCSGASRIWPLPPRRWANVARRASFARADAAPGALEQLSGNQQRGRHAPRQMLNQFC